MKAFILFIALSTLLTVGCKKESIHTIKPNLSTPVKDNKIIKPYIHPYFERYSKYHDDLNSLYINHQNKKSQGGC